MKHSARQSRGSRICAAAHGGQVLLSRVTYDLVTADVEVLDLGEHLLKDIEAPERLFQLLAPGLRDQFPPPRAWAPGNLPRTRTRFFGRERELDDIHRLLYRGDSIAFAPGLLAAQGDQPPLYRPGAAAEIASARQSDRVPGASARAGV